MQPPRPPRRPTEKSSHGHRRHDDYAYFKKRTPAVDAHLELEKLYLEHHLTPLETLERSIYEDSLRHVELAQSSYPVQFGNHDYYSRTLPNEEYSLICRRPRTPGGPEEILLDVPALAREHEYYDLDLNATSDDGTHLAYLVDTTGEGYYTLYVKDLRNGTLLPFTVENVATFEWTTRSDTLVYVTTDTATNRPDKAWVHTFNSPPELLYIEHDEEFSLDLLRSSDDDVIFLSSESKTSSEVQFISAENPFTSPKLIRSRTPGHLYYADRATDAYYIRSNQSSVEFSLYKAPLDDPETWTPLEAHDPSVTIEHVSFFKDYMIVSELESLTPHLRVVNRATGTSYRVSVPETIYSLEEGENYEYDTTTMLLSYSSPVTPSQIWRLDLATGTTTIVHRAPVHAYDPSDYTATRLWIPARDGTKVPCTLLYAKSTVPSPQTPLILYGYGAYGDSTDVDFSISTLPILDRGVIYAVAHVRGGGELGEHWHHRGRLQEKMNSFTDFVDVAEYLVKEGYTSPRMLASHGISAGGLLVTAAMNERPDLFKAVLAQVPFVDVLNTMLDPTIPLTTGEYLEWGDPNIKEHYEYMARYSPYDNVRSAPYPSVMIEVSLHDANVPYWEGSKLAFKLRDNTTSDNPILLRVAQSGGHAGPSGRFAYLKDVACIHAWLLSQIAPGCLE